MNEAQRKMLEITDKYNIDGAMSTFEMLHHNTRKSDKLAAYDKIA